MLGSVCAKAEERPSARSTYLDNPISLGVQMAPFGGPTGLLGLWADVALLPELSLTGGAGMGTAGSIFQYAIALRPRIPIRPVVALDLTVGLSRGDYTRLVELDLAGQGQDELYRNCTWFNVDVGPELRFSNGMGLHPFAGFSKLIASDTSIWRGDDYKKDERSVRWPSLLYAGVAFGYYL